MKQWIIVLQQFSTYTVKKCNWEDKNFRKVRNHCHSAGKSEQPAYIPVLAHNSSGNCKHWDCKSLNIVWNIKIGKSNYDERGRQRPLATGGNKKRNHFDEKWERR